MPEEVRSDHPTEASWRADALVGSRHSRLLDHLSAPLADPDPERAVRLCAQVCRRALQDFAPALMLLPRGERRRIQVLAAYALILFDFAHQQGVEGERLSEINRWEFNLDLALSGAPPPQPVFVGLATEQARRPWRREAFAELARAARARVTRPRPADRRRAQEEARRLGGALAEALLGVPPSPGVAAFAAGLLQLNSLQNLGEELRRRRARLPVSELPEPHPTRPIAAEQLEGAVLRQCTEIRPLLLGLARELHLLEPVLRRATLFAMLAGQRLLVRIETMGAAVVDRPPRLGLLSRIDLLLRARWLTQRYRSTPTTTVRRPDGP